MTSKILQNIAKSPKFNEFCQIIIFQLDNVVNLSKWCKTRVYCTLLAKIGADTTEDEPNVAKMVDKSLQFFAKSGRRRLAEPIAVFASVTTTLQCPFDLFPPPKTSRCGIPNVLASFRLRRHMLEMIRQGG